MKRRTVIKAASAGALAALALRGRHYPVPADEALPIPALAEHAPAPVDPPAMTEAINAQYEEGIAPPTPKLCDASDYNDDTAPAKIVREGPHVVLTGKEFDLLQQVSAHLGRVQKQIGYANFNLLGFDRMLHHARDYSAIGEFTQAELDFMERIFFTEASHFGFLGDKVIRELTANIPEKDTVKIRNTGHYVFRGESEQMYQRIRRDVGESVVLTSGVRGIAKQMHLFLAKAVYTHGDLSLASHSLAPPGHSYHGVGDFDVGKVGFGHRNFTEDFAHTDEYQRLTDLGYVLIRYTDGNPFGVRYEPWHIKVV